MRYLLLITLIVVLLPGCGGGGGGGGTADTTGPTIANLTAPSPATSAGGTVTISAQVTDAGGVGTVTATVTKPDNSTENVAMTASGGTYSGTFAAPANSAATPATYTVVVTATDTGGRQTTSSPVTFAVPALTPDTTGPTISALSAPSPADFNGGAVTITCNVTDPSGVANVDAAVLLPDGTTTVVNLTGSGGAYSGTFSAAANSGTLTADYSVVVTATDTAGNATSSSAVTFSVPTPFITTASGLKYWDYTTGLGAAAAVGNLVTVHYTGRLADGTVFDTSKQPGRTPFTFRLGVGQVIAGWDEGVQGVRVGGVRRLVIPPNLGYGGTPVGSIPANSTLYFEVEMLSISN